MMMLNTMPTRDVRKTLYPTRRRPTDPPHDYDDVNQEVEACVQQAASVNTARDEESAPEPDHDHDDVNQEVEACVPHAASVTTSRDEESPLVGHRASVRAWCTPPAGIDLRGARCRQ
ncbi:unnamed protein product [Phytophthora fragariaefolia]|uniref:Unnamed protein product n=1 Tax=Phytophthora fragariaefolia TaxID=1490495 RepID=A0A9W6XMC6_9STRA|nr:unnamed protein product [Phytophthora fragariaefolia]